MMITKIYAIKDCVVGEFMPQLYLFPNDDSAKRWFENARAKADYPNDLQLFYVGGFNLSMGCITSDPDLAGESLPIFLM